MNLVLVLGIWRVDEEVSFVAGAEDVSEVVDDVADAAAHNIHSWA
jgi:hypothetical protein